MPKKPIVLLQKSDSYQVSVCIRHGFATNTESGLVDLDHRQNLANKWGKEEQGGEAKVENETVVLNSDHLDIFITLSTQHQQMLPIDRAIGFRNILLDCFQRYRDPLHFASIEWVAGTTLHTRSQLHFKLSLPHRLNDLPPSPPSSLPPNRRLESIFLDFEWSSSSIQPHLFVSNPFPFSLSLLLSSLFPRLLQNAFLGPFPHLFNRPFHLRSISVLPLLTSISTCLQSIQSMRGESSRWITTQQLVLLDRHVFSPTVIRPNLSSSLRNPSFDDTFSVFSTDDEDPQHQQTEPNNQTVTADLEILAFPDELEHDQDEILEFPDDQDGWYTKELGL